MNPFLEVPIVIGNNEGKDKDTVAKIQPGEIEYFYPGFYHGTSIIMKSGHIFLCQLEYEQFSQALASYNDFTKAKPDQFGTLSAKKTEPSKLITLKPN